MTINLDEIEKALGGATPGPWEHIKRIDHGKETHYIRPTYMGEYVAQCGSEQYYSDKDAHLIANAPEWLRLLVERVRRLESDKGMAEADASHFCAGLCVHPRGVIGDDGGSACCPITGTRDALVDGKKVVL